MGRRYQLPTNKVTRSDGRPSMPWHSYLTAIENISRAANDIENLDASTGYTNAELRDKIREIIIALQG